MRFVVAAFVVVVSVSCVKRIVQTPPEAAVTLGGVRATYRDYAFVPDLCFLDPAVIHRDLDSMSALLAGFLGQTSAGPDGMWADEHVALLEEAQRALPTPLDVQRRGLAQAAKASCRFEGLSRAKELNELAQRRLIEAPTLLEVVKAKKALAAWREGLPASRQAARERACAPPPKGAKGPTEPVVFAAFEDEKNRIEWLFCDGAKVAAAPGSPPAFEPPPVDPAVKKPKKAPDAKAYLEVQAKFPPAEVSRAPKVPARRTARRDDGPEPE
ncbi:MAG: hypothetical protein INH41_30915 [Myxococcaceae bacterium]|jgi:hypothetical protein|nr:hypothetical protein [Myxococcaceae bacterium]MCA3016818.1 hypothetical protein [Myxococcaceae bacterium]